MTTESAFMDEAPGGDSDGGGGRARGFEARRLIDAGLVPFVLERTRRILRPRQEGRRSGRAVDRRVHRRAVGRRPRCVVARRLLAIGRARRIEEGVVARGLVVVARKLLFAERRPRRVEESVVARRARRHVARRIVVPRRFFAQLVRRRIPRKPVGRRAFERRRSRRALAQHVVEPRRRGRRR